MSEIDNMDLENDREDYDPDQPLEERRRIQQGIRNLEKDMLENADEYLKPTSKRIAETLKALDEYSVQIRQTNEAAIDSKALLAISEIQHRKIKQLTAGNLGSGVDADELVSKCITYMRKSAGVADDEDDALTHTQRHRRMPRGAMGSDDDASDDEDGSGGDMMNWAHLGRYACIPSVRRPALPGFLLGPLSVQKKVRKVVTRTAPLRIRDLQEVRPEVLDKDDLAKNEKQDLTAICNKILKRLQHVRNSAISQVQEIHEDQDKDGDDLEAAMETLGLTENGNIDLVRFCINPRSFGQTVENMFYVSFLIREGMVQVDYEDNGLPSLCERSMPVPFRSLSNATSQARPPQVQRSSPSLQHQITVR